MNFTKILTFAIIAMFLLVPFASAKQEVADSVKQDKKIDEKITDKTKGSAKEISNKGKDIKGKVTVTDSDSSKYKVEKKSKTEISISKDEATGEHTKSKVSISKSDLDAIDIDKDGKFGILRIGDNGEILDKDILTTAQLTSGAEMVFSTNIVNGYSGHKAYTFYNVTSGQTLNIDDVSGNYTIGVAVDGTVPTYTAGIPTRELVGYWPLQQNASDMSGHGLHGTCAGRVDFNNGSAYIGEGNISISHSTLMNSDTITLVGSVKLSPVPIDTQPVGTLFGIFAQSRIYKYSTNYLVYELYSPEVYKDTNYLSNTSWKTYGMTYNSSGDRKLWYYVDASRVGSVQGTATAIDNTAAPFYIGGLAPVADAPVGLYRDVAMYSTDLSTSEYAQYYARGSGISFQPEPSYNFTGYNVASGVEKVLDTDSTCTGIEYIDTTGGTHNVIVTVYFTEDTTLISDSKGPVYQNVSIVHTKQNATATVGTITYELDPLYSGTPTLTSNNTNATVTRTDTSFVISTGLVKQGESFSYAVSVADDHNHGIHLNTLMKWVGTGWDFVSTAPDNWDDYIGDEIEVTVS